MKYEDRAGYGKKLIKHLATDLKISRALLFEVIQFYKVYPIVHTLCGQLSWSHYKLLIKLNVEIRQFYEKFTVYNSWSVRQLKQKIKNEEHLNKTSYKNTPSKRTISLPKPEDIFKESYNWSFLKLTSNHTEKELESELINNIQKTLLEFGHGFSFSARQQKILIAGQWHKVDLVFYNRFLRCPILIELKTEKFKRDHVAQMNQYLNYFKENDLIEGERTPIGIIICKEKNHEEVHYALGDLKKDIFVAEYKTYLPNEKELIKKLKKIKQ
ncbi:DUF1016 family protein [Candidatus Woesearchaeota archaeon]|nr:DUF1016 family protein [Candidatus Woesearchaeota archaeon]MBT7367762.1 DUF1016 family protein [Candidatus Woesearchaeota archaeon]